MLSTRKQSSKHEKITPFTIKKILLEMDENDKLVFTGIRIHKIIGCVVSNKLFLNVDERSRQQLIWNFISQKLSLELQENIEYIFTITKDEFHKNLTSWEKLFFLKSGSKNY